MTEVIGPASVSPVEKQVVGSQEHADSVRSTLRFPSGCVSTWPAAAVGRGGCEVAAQCCVWEVF